jgi:hypothetical protein
MESRPAVRYRGLAGRWLAPMALEGRLRGMASGTALLCRFEHYLSFFLTRPPSGLPRRFVDGDGGSLMIVVEQRCAFLDVHRDTVMACARLPNGHGGRREELWDAGTLLPSRACERRDRIVRLPQDRVRRRSSRMLLKVLDPLGVLSRCSRPTHHERVTLAPPTAPRPHRYRADPPPVARCHGARRLTQLRSHPRAVHLDPRATHYGPRSGDGLCLSGDDRCSLGSVSPFRGRGRRRRG